MNEDTLECENDFDCLGAVLCFSISHSLKKNESLKKTKTKKLYFALRLNFNFSQNLSDFIYPDTPWQTLHFK